MCCMDPVGEAVEGVKMVKDSQSYELDTHSSPPPYHLLVREWFS